jgi:ribonuclease HI
MIVANKRSVDCKNDWMVLSASVSLSSTSFLSPGVSEKKAISVAEITAERHRNTMEMRSAITALIETAEKWRSENKFENDSESKMNQYIYI